MSITAIMLVGVAMASTAFLAFPQEDADRRKALAAPFEAMEKAIKDKDEAGFKATWRPEGFDKNLVGGSGLPGKAVFEQGGRKKWFPKPDLDKAKILEDGAAVIVPCEIWAWEKGRAVDKVDFLIVREKDGYRALGGGEKRDQVDALASRFLKKAPLEPPKEKD
jgi:hypothetical protein